MSQFSRNSPCHCFTSPETISVIKLFADSPADSPGFPLSHFFVVDSFNIHRLVIAGVTCASKFFSDVFYTNSRYAKVRPSVPSHFPIPKLTTPGRRSSPSRAQPPRTSIPSPKRLPSLRPRRRTRSLRHHARRILRPRGHRTTSRRNASRHGLPRRR